jgi:hypothetical protein
MNDPLKHPLETSDNRKPASKLMQRMKESPRNPRNIDTLQRIPTRTNQLRITDNQAKQLAKVLPNQYEDPDTTMKTTKESLPQSDNPQLQAHLSIS